MRPVAGRRAWPAIAYSPKIGPDLDRARRRPGQIRVTGAARQETRGRGNVDDHPMPPAAAGRSVGIVDRHRVALRRARRPAPTQLRRDVGAVAAEAAIDLLVLNGRARRDL